MDDRTKERVRELMTGAYRRLDSALYDWKDGYAGRAKDRLSDVLDDLKAAYRMME